MLKPTDFDSYLARKRQNFFGRKWLFDSILTRLESHRLLLVVGDPGVGKSAAMAELIHRNFDGRVDAYHFCRADQPSTLRPGAFVRSIAAMLGARHRDYGERLEAGEFRDVLREAESDADPRRALEAGVLEPLNEIVLPEGEYRILVLDSLDEALRLDGQGASPLQPDRELSMVEVLSGQLKIFPDWLRLLATARNEPAAIDPQRLFSLAASGEVKQLRGDLELYPLDAAWRGSILVALAWAEVVRNRGLAKALRDEAASHIPESEPELVRLDEHLASGTVEDRIAMEPTESRIVALLAQVGGAPIGEHLTEEIYQLAEELHARQAEYSAENITEGATERRASHAELFAAEFVAFAARSPASGDRYLDSYIDRHAQNTYRHYRRSALRTILRAVLDHPESEWIGKRLTAIVEAELTASSPEFTECSPAALASLRHPAEFDQYTDDARRAASELPENPERGEGDTWGSRKRRLGAAAEGRSRGRDDVQGAKQLLQEGLKIPYGFAGFQAPACLSFAESIRIADPDPGTLIDDALQAARDAAHNIFEQTFAIRMTSRCNAIIEDWWPHIPDIDKVIDRFTADPSQPEFSALHIVGGSFAGRRPDAEEIPYALQQDRPSLADLALAFDQPTGETRRLNPGLPGTGGLSQGTRVRIPDPEFPPMLASRLAAEALVTLPDLHRKVLAIRKLLPIATDNITMLDLVISRLIHAIAALQDGAALLDTIEPVLATWFPRLPDPKASAKDLLAAMASSQPASVNSRD